MQFLLLLPFLKPVPQTQAKPAPPIAICATVDASPAPAPGAPCSNGFVMISAGGVLSSEFYIAAVPGFTNAPFFGVFNGVTIKLK